VYCTCISEIAHFRKYPFSLGILAALNQWKSRTITKTSFPVIYDHGRKLCHTPPERRVIAQ